MVFLYVTIAFSAAVFSWVFLIAPKIQKIFTDPYLTRKYRPYKYYAGKLLETPNVLGKNQLVKIATYDPDPVADRTIIVFLSQAPEKDFDTTGRGVFGITRGQKFFGGGNFPFNPNLHKIYFGVFTGEKEHCIKDIARALGDILTSLDELKGKNFYFVGFSKSAIIARAALNENILLAARVKIIFSIAGTHHGSPIIQPGWWYSKMGIKKKIYGKIFLHVLKKNYKGAIWEYDLAWDNYDGSEPDVLHEWEDVHQILGDEFHSVTRAELIDTRYLVELNNRDEYMDRVIAICGKIQKGLIPDLFCCGWNMRIMVKIVGMLVLAKLMAVDGSFPFQENDGVIPYKSMSAQGLEKIEVISFSGDLTHYDFLLNIRFLRKVAEDVFSRFFSV
jgi:hypothetical protein